MILKKSFIRIMIFQIGTQETFCVIIAVKYSLSAQLYSKFFSGFFNEYKIQKK